MAEAVGTCLQRDNDLLAALYKRFAERRLTMPENNARQADVIFGAEALPNARGSAPGDRNANGHFVLPIGQLLARNTRSAVSTKTE